MEMIFLLFLLWVIVTVVGHASWIAARGFLRRLTGTIPTAHRAPSTPESDFDASRRILDRIYKQGIIAREEAAKWFEAIRCVELGQSTTTIHPEPTPANQSSTKSQLEAIQATDSSPLVHAPTDLGTSVNNDSAYHESSTNQTRFARARRELETSRRNHVDQVKRIDQEVAQGETEQYQSEAEIAPPPPAFPIVSTSAGDSTSQSASSAVARTDTTGTQAAWASESQSPQPSQRRSLFSRYELIQSFLATHNIRWGELAAGMLIVICSIGLVINLWNPLVQTHRVIPSLIFLAANAAIFSAGLYTLSRWRLRHTGRAVLLIAILLVPLSVLAGLAAAGTGQGAVTLSDPITLASIAVAGIVYIVLLLRGSRALVGRSLAIPLTAAVAGPVSLLPVLPAAVRNLGNSSGWILMVGSLVLLWVCQRINRDHPHPNRRIGPAVGKAWLTLMSLGGFAIAVTVGYAAFLTRQLTVDAWLAIAVAVMPVLIALSATGRRLSMMALRATHAMVGSSISVLLGMGACLALPPAMVSPFWVIAWALVVAASAVWVAWRLRMPHWSAIASVALGLGAVLGSPVWLSGRSWDTLLLWQRILSGDALVMSAVAAIGTLGVASICGKLARRSLSVAAQFWCACSILIAAALSVLPASLLGIVPWWVPTVVLVGSGVFAIRLTSSNRRWAHRFWAISVVVATIFSWCTILRPIVWTETIAGPTRWMSMGVAVAVTLQAIVELMTRSRLRTLASPTRNLCAAPDGVRWSTKLWSSSAAVAAVAGCVPAVWYAGTLWPQSAITLTSTTLVLLWIGVSTKDPPLLNAAQFTSVILAGVIGYGRFGQWMYSSLAAHDGTAVWAWALAMGLVSTFWTLLRSAGSHWHTSNLIQPLSQILDRPNQRRWMVDDGLMLSVVALVGLGATRLYLSQVSTLFGYAAGYGAPVWLSAVAMMVAGGTTALRLLQKPTRASDAALATTWLISVSIWIAFELSRWMTLSAQWQVITGSSVAVGLIAVPYVIRWFGLRGRMSSVEKDLIKRPVISWIPIGTISALVGVSSCGLLRGGWLEPLSIGNLAHPIPTLAVSTWWMLGSLALFITAYQVGRIHVAWISLLLATASSLVAAGTIASGPPITWIQTAAIVVAGWAWLAHRWFAKWVNPSDPAFGRIATSASAFATAVGTLTCGWISAAMIADLPYVDGVSARIGFSISIVALVIWVRPAGDWFPSPTFTKTRLPWSIALSLIAGQLAWLGETIGMLQGIHVLECMLALWLVASLLSLVSDWRNGSGLQFAHAATIALASTIAAVQTIGTSSMTSWIALLSIASCGIRLPIIRSRSTSRWMSVVRRTVAWLVIIAGSFVLRFGIAGNGTTEIQWTVLLAWSLLWLATWRGIPYWQAGQKPQQMPQSMLADMELSALILLAGIFELTTWMLADGALPADDKTFWIRVLMYFMASGTTLARATYSASWPIGIASFVTATALTSVSVSVGFDTDRSLRAAIALTTLGFTTALISHWTPLFATLIARQRRLHDTAHASVTARDLVGHLATSVHRIAIVIGLAAALMAIAQELATGDVTVALQLMIGTVALSGWAIAVSAEVSDHDPIRHTAITFLLATFMLWASVGVSQIDHGLLVLMMRWLVAMVCAIPLMLWVIPVMVGRTLARRWQIALRRGVFMATAISAASLIAMLATEIAIRTPTGIDRLPAAMVIGVTTTLGILSVMAALVAIASGPQSQWKDRLKLSNQQRSGLIIAAQVTGFLAWLHLYLCRPDWAFIGIRGMWPYAVMALAFASAAATEWARRHRDEVMSKTLSVTALYMPLIPVVGFWISQSAERLAWIYPGGVVRYDVLLMIGCIYYFGIATLWNRATARVIAIVLGNAAWWVVLAQRPSWTFLAHPQLWMIPPAVCVLAMAHLYRNRLHPHMATAIRYAATLVIYISSTADMLFQEIGTNLAGPMVLVILSLAGMGAGVVLRVRSFLYLGALFLFVAVTSMVWHAQRSFDAVWPWWAFGITMGILLLAGLMAIEKNKDRLQSYARQLSTWQ